MTNTIGFIAIAFVLGFSVHSLLTQFKVGLSPSVLLETSEFKANDVDLSPSELLETSEFKAKDGELCQRKYVLLTTQRSGSTWFAGVLDQQPEISCGYIRNKDLPQPRMEKMRHKLRDTWPKYKEELDKSFKSVCETNPGPSIGFKLMYNQIPPQFIEDKSLQTYFEDNGVKIIHLVRDAKILNIASWQEGEKRGFMETTHSKAIEKSKKSPPPLFEWNEEVIDKMLEKEKEVVEWQNTIFKMTPRVPNYYVSYENLLDKQKRKHAVEQIVTFVSGNFHPNVQAVDGVMLQLSDSTCSARIANYTEFRRHERVIGSRSAAACDLIDMII